MQDEIIYTLNLYLKLKQLLQNFAKLAAICHVLLQLAEIRFDWFFPRPRAAFLSLVGSHLEDRNRRFGI